jgi:hypothetical protein
MAQKTNNFEFAAGSVTGRDHAAAGKNNQDAACRLQTQFATVLLVCDGCSSGERSEVGAFSGARIVAHAIATCAERHTKPEALLEDARKESLAGLRELKNLLRLNCIQELLFTVVGALITAETTVLFSIGDGVAAVNGEVIVIGPFPGNAPPYLAYGLNEKDEPRFQIHRVLKTSDVQTLLIGTDGVADLVRLAGHTMPGRCDSVGPLEQFWREDRYLKNPDMIRRRLALINRCATNPDWERRSIDRQIGLLRDDTTLIVARRILESEEGRQP